LSIPMPEPFIDAYSRRFIYERYVAHADETLPLPAPSGPQGDPVRELHDQQVYLRKLVAETVAPVRIEPENPYVVHTAVPSVRGLMANQLVLVSAGTAWRYCAATVAWHAVADPCLHPMQNGRTLLLIQSDFLVLGPKYGEFAVSLALLDAGHLVQGIREVALELGCDVHVTYFPGTRSDQRLRHVLLAQIDVTALLVPEMPLMASQETHCPVAHALTGTEEASLWRPGPETCTLIDSICADESREIVTQAPRLVPGRSSARRVRSSVHTSQGLAFVLGSVPEVLLSDMVRTGQWWAEDEIISVVMLVRDGNGYFVLDLDTYGAHPLGMWPLAPSALLRHPRDSIAFEDMILAALVMVNLVPLRCEGAAAVATSIVRAGEVAQALSVTAAGVGLGARPLKDINERRIMEVLGTDRVPMHMVVAGYPAATSLAVATRRKC